MDLGLKQKEVARIIGVTESSIWNWEHGSNPGKRNIGRIEGFCEGAYQDILKLSQFHKQMDNIGLKAYGWEDINLAHDFYEVDFLPENDRIRFAI